MPLDFPVSAVIRSGESDGRIYLNWEQGMFRDIRGSGGCIISVIKFLFPERISHSSSFISFPADMDSNSTCPRLWFVICDRNSVLGRNSELRRMILSWSKSDPFSLVFLAVVFAC